MNTRDYVLAVLGLTLAIMIASLPSVSALSLIQECGDPEYRETQADVIFHGTVTDFENIGTGIDAHGEITFAVDAVQKGDVGETFVLRQEGRNDHGQLSDDNKTYDYGPVIPGLTLDWKVGDQYKIQAAEHEDGYSLVCAMMGRTLIMEGSPQAPNNDKGSEGLCAQVITHAKDPETGDVHMYPTPCDVPEGWDVVDEPIPVEPDGGIGDGAGPIVEEPPLPKASLWQRFTGWLASIF